MDIYSFPFRGYDIEMTLQNGNVAYTFSKFNKEKKEDEYFGYKIKLGDKKQKTVMVATAQLVMNAVDTIELLEKNEKDAVQ